MEKVTDNKKEHRYELNHDGYTAFIEYIRTQGGDVNLTHTEVPYAIQNQGVGRELVKQTLQMIKDNGEKVVPLCGFVAAYIRRNPEWKSIVKEGINV